MGLTRLLYTFSFAVDAIFKFLLRKPILWFALLHVLLICLLYARSDVMWHPRYLSTSTDFKMWPWSLCSCFIGLIFLLMVSTLHFSGWSIFFHLCFHIGGLFRSSCSLSWSASDVAVAKLSWHLQTGVQLSLFLLPYHWCRKGIGSALIQILWDTGFHADIFRHFTIICHGLRSTG